MSRNVLLILCVLPMLFGSIAPADVPKKIEGKLTVNGQAVTLTAVHIREFRTENGGAEIYIFLSDYDPKYEPWLWDEYSVAFKPHSNLTEVIRKGSRHVVLIRTNRKNEVLGVSIFHNKLDPDGGPFDAGTPGGISLKVTADNIQGTASTKSAGKIAAGAYQITATFEAPYEALIEAGGGEPGKVYEQYIAAARAKDASKLQSFYTTRTWESYEKNLRETFNSLATKFDPSVSVIIPGGFMMGKGAVLIVDFKKTVSSISTLDNVFGVTLYMQDGKWKMTMDPQGEREAEKYAPEKQQIEATSRLKPPAPLKPGEAFGTMTVNGKTFPLKFAHGEIERHAPDLVLYSIEMSDSILSAAELDNDYFALKAGKLHAVYLDLKKDGKINQVGVGDNALPDLRARCEYGNVTLSHFDDKSAAGDLTFACDENGIKYSANAKFNVAWANP